MPFLQKSRFEAKANIVHFVTQFHVRFYVRCVMLIRASFKDRDAVDEAVATLPIWWPLIALPAETRERIDRVTNIPLSQRRKGDEPKIARAKVQMFLSELKALRQGRR